MTKDTYFTFSQKALLTLGEYNAASQDPHPCPVSREGAWGIDCHCVVKIDIVKYRLPLRSIAMGVRYRLPLCSIDCQGAWGIYCQGCSIDCHFQDKTTTEGWPVVSRTQHNCREDTKLSSLLYRRYLHYPTYRIYLNYPPCCTQREQYCTNGRWHRQAGAECHGMHARPFMDPISSWCFVIYSWEGCLLRLCVDRKCRKLDSCRAASMIASITWIRLDRA